MDDGISAAEMQETQENYAGAPKRPTTSRPITPELKQALEAYSQELTKWRLAVSMDKGIQEAKENVRRSRCIDVCIQDY